MDVTKDTKVYFDTVACHHGNHVAFKEETSQLSFLIVTDKAPEAYDFYSEPFNLLSSGRSLAVCHADVPTVSTITPQRTSPYVPSDIGLLNVTICSVVVNCQDFSGYVFRAASNAKSM